MPDSIIKAVTQERARLATLHDLRVLDTPSSAGFDRLVGLAARMIGVPVALVSLVDGDRQFFKSLVGLPEPWAEREDAALAFAL